MFWGGRENRKSRRIFGYKTHSTEDIHNFPKTILLIRNPFDAVVAQFSLRQAKLGENEHINHLSQELFDDENWPKFAKLWIHIWESRNAAWILKSGNLRTIYYEDLAFDLEAGLKTLATAANVRLNEERLECVLKFPQGFFKRLTEEKRKEFPYSRDLQISAKRSICRITKLLNRGRFPRLPIERYELRLKERYFGTKLKPLPTNLSDCSL